MTSDSALPATQHRMVAKANALMEQRNRLEASRTATRRRLLDALLAEALTPVDAPKLETAE